MSWRDSDYDDDPYGRSGRPGGDWQGIRPSLDNPMSWSVPLGRVFGIAVRVHLVFLIFIVVQLARSLASDSTLGFALVALNLGGLFGIVLLHEFGHCFACRYTGGESHEILMWPLGGLAFCLPENKWKAHLITAAGGPMVNVAICVVLAPVLWAVTGQFWGVAVPNPLGYLTFGMLERQSWWLLALLAVQRMSLMLLLFNLLPIFPLDGGRICQSILWRWHGYVRSMRLAVYAGYIGAIGLGIFGAVVNQFMLIAIAVFGGVTCYMTLKQLQFTESFMAEEDDAYAQSLRGGKGLDGSEGEGAGKPSRSEKKAAKREEQEENEAVEVDRILAKIAETGMGSLSGGEKRLLKRATEKKRQGQV